MDIQFIQLKKKWDPRRFKAHKTVGTFPISQVPNTFGDRPKVIKNQGTTNFCSGFTASYILDRKLQIETSPEYVIQKESLMYNSNPKNFLGVPVDVAHKALCRYGSIPANLSPYKVGVTDPSIIADPLQWDVNLDDKALVPFGSSFEVTKDGYIDLFDAARAIMYSQNVWLDCSGYFIPEWMYAPKGIIPTIFKKQEVNGHMFTICGSQDINGVPYLVIPNSWGIDIGGQIDSMGIIQDKGGFFFAPREAINTLFDISVMLDRNSQDAKQEQWNAMQKIYDKIITILKFLQKIVSSFIK